jgi:hypothetical protein
METMAKQEISTKFRLESFMGRKQFGDRNAKRAVPNAEIYLA